MNDAARKRKAARAVARLEVRDLLADVLEAERGLRLRVGVHRVHTVAEEVT
jgi:hypothetical protein